MTDGARSTSSESAGFGRAPYYEDDAVTIYHGDCLEVLSALGPGLADVVLTDPPYNVGKDYGDHDDKKTDEAHDAWLRRCLLRATRDVQELVFFTGTKNFPRAGIYCPTGFRIHRILGWHRREFAGDKWTGGPAMSWEPIVWASRSEKPFFNRIFGHWGRDFMIVPSVKEDPYRKLHPCPKPYSVMKWLVGLFVPPGGTVLDPFMGTGTTLLAAREAGARAIGIELEESFCELAVQRLKHGAPKDPAQEVMAI